MVERKEAPGKPLCIRHVSFLRVFRAHLPAIANFFASFISTPPYQTITDTTVQNRDFRRSVSSPRRFSLHTQKNTKPPLIIPATTITLRTPYTRSLSPNHPTNMATDSSTSIEPSILGVFRLEFGCLGRNVV